MALCQMWCTADDLCCDKSGFTDDQIAEAIFGASQVLSRDSYNKYGICDYTVQPCTTGCSAPCWDRKCQGQAITVEILSGIPIVDVTAINVFDTDGDPVTNDYLSQIWFDFNVIYFPKDFVFPKQIAGPIGSANTWNIELTAGVAIPVVGKKAAAELAEELLKDPCDSSCALPPEIKSVSRDGGTFELLDVKNALSLLPRVNFFYQKFCQTRRWSGAVSPLNQKIQLVQ